LGRDPEPIPARRNPADSTADTLISRPACRGSTCTPWYFTISDDGRTTCARTRACAYSRSNRTADDCACHAARHCAGGRAA